MAVEQSPGAGGVVLDVDLPYRLAGNDLRQRLVLVGVEPGVAGAELAQQLQRLGDLPQLHPVLAGLALHLRDDLVERRGALEAIRRSAHSASSGTSSVARSRSAMLPARTSAMPRARLARNSSFSQTISSRLGISAIGVSRIRPSLCRAIE